MHTCARAEPEERHQFRFGSAKMPDISNPHRMPATKGAECERDFEAQCIHTARAGSHGWLLPEEALAARCREPWAFASARSDWSSPSVQLRGDYYARCSLRVLLPHKAGSTEVESFFERLCGPRSAAPTNPSEPPTLLALARDPDDRAISMYNMWISGRNAPASHEETSYLSATELARTQMHAQPTAVDVRWRFERFLAWLATDPPLTPGGLGQDRLTVMRRWHYRPQARYFGVGARNGSMPVSLFGRVEALPEVVAHLLRASPTVAAAHDRAAAAFVPAWRHTSTLVLSGWRMSPCLMTNRTRALVRAAFRVDDVCLARLLRSASETSQRAACPAPGKQ